MRELGLNFTFRSRDQNPISNHVVYVLRREVAQTLERHGLGAVVELPNQQFQNEIVAPAIDDFNPVENELHISYYMPFPLREIIDFHRLFEDGIPDLENFTRNLNCELSFRTVIL